MKTKNWGFVLLVLLALAVAGAAYWVAPVSIGRVTINITMVVSLLLTIFVITLFVERAQEVILTNWRALGSETLDLKILTQEKRLKRLEQTGAESGVVESQYHELQLLKLEKLQYRARTRIYALRIGVIMGLAVSLAGVRSLGVLVPETVIAHFAPLQQMIFHGVDVIITGGVIAGGSDGVHKMAELYRVFVETRSKQQKQRLSPLGD